MKISNCTMLSISTSDPLLMYIRILNQRNRFNDIFDNGFIAVCACNNNLDTTQIDYIKDYFNRINVGTNNLKIEFIDGVDTNHGVNIGTLVRNNWDQIRDTILLMEDDDFIVNDNEMVKILKRIQNGEIDFFGGARGNCNNNDYMEFAKKIISEDNLIENVGVDYHPHFWPTHFMIGKRFINKDDAFDTFFSKSGKEINFRGRNYKFEMDTVGDTFVAFCMKLWNRINKCHIYEVYKLGTPEYIDKFNYSFSSGKQYNWLDLNLNTENLELKALHYHIGSASCLRRFWIKDIDILNEAMFREISIFLNKNDIDSILEIYRRYHIYKRIYNLVKNDNEFSEFKEGYDKNFLIADDYFNRIKIDDMIATRDYKMMPDYIFNNVFSYITGK